MREPYNFYETMLIPDFLPKSPRYCDTDHVFHKPMGPPGTLEPHLEQPLLMDKASHSTPVEGLCYFEEAPRRDSVTHLRKTWLGSCSSSGGKREAQPGKCSLAT